MAIKIKTSIFIFIGIIILLVVSTFAFSSFTIGQIRGNLKTQVRSRSLILALKDNLIHLDDAETGERGYVITGDSNYLEPYHHALENISLNISQLSGLTEGSRLQKDYLDSLKYFISLKLSYIEKVISLKSHGREEDIKKILISNNGKIFMDGARRANAAILGEEEILFVRHSGETDKSVSVALIVFVAEAALSLLITIYLASTVFKELLRRVRAERKIKAAYKELERQNLEIEQFAYIASHDLQEPLRSISNFSMLSAESLQNGDSASAREYIGYVDRGAKRMGKLIAALLEYSRVTKDDTKVPIDCNKLLDEVQEELSVTIAETGAHISISPLPVVSGYEYLRSVFLNLVSNGLKFHAKGSEPEIRVSASERQDDFLFEVSDNGIGIEPEYFDRIFKIFQRLHPRAEYEGTGIGLSQCKKIIGLHGGEIWLTSEMGKGTAFFFTIPKS